MTDYVPWLHKLSEEGGKGVVGNIDARALGRVADEIEYLRGYGGKDWAFNGLLLYSVAMTLITLWQWIG